MSALKAILTATAIATLAVSAFARPPADPSRSPAVLPAVGTPAPVNTASAPSTKDTPAKPVEHKSEHKDAKKAEPAKK